MERRTSLISEFPKRWATVCHIKKSSTADNEGMGGLSLRNNDSFHPVGVSFDRYLITIYTSIATSTNKKLGFFFVLKNMSSLGTWTFYVSRFRELRLPLTFASLILSKEKLSSHQWQSSYFKTYQSSSSWWLFLL